MLTRWKALFAGVPRPVLILICAGLAGGLYALSSQSKTAGEQADQASPAPSASSPAPELDLSKLGNPLRGNASAPQAPPALPNNIAGPDFAELVQPIPSQQQDRRDLGHLKPTDEEPIVSQSLGLKHFTVQSLYESFDPALRLHMGELRTSGNQSSFEISFTPRSRLLVSGQGEQIELSGQQSLVKGWGKIFAAMDAQAPGTQQKIQFVAPEQKALSPVRKALAAVSPESAAADDDTAVVPGPGRAAFVAFRQQQDAEGAPAAQAAPATAPPADPAGAAAAQNNPPANNQPPAAGGVPAGNVADAAGGVLGQVRVEFLEGLDVIVIRGRPADVDRVVQIINEIEQLAAQTQPRIEVLPLKHVASEPLAILLQPLYSQVLVARTGGVSITPLVKPNALLLIGRDESVAAVLDLIARLDVAAEPAGEFHVFRLKHAGAAELKVTVDEFYAERTGLGPKVRATADPWTNSLIVHASPRDLAEVSALIQRLDSPTSDAVNELRVFQLQNALAEELATVLNEAMAQQIGAQRGGVGGQGPLAQLGGAAAGAGGGAGQQARVQQARSVMLHFLTIDANGGEQQFRSGILRDVKITADVRANALVVSAPAASMGLISALIQQLDQMPAAESQIKVFTIANSDASSLVEMLESLFGTQGTTRNALGPAVGGAGGQDNLVRLRFSVDQRTNSIIASGTMTDLTVVEALLLRLDESDVRQRKSVVYRLKNSPATDVATAVNELLRSERQVQQTTPGLISPFEQIEREVVVVPEPVSNSLIVSSTPRYFEEIRKLVEQLDERPPMVMIQVLIGEVTLNNVDEFGVEFGFQDSLLFDRSLIGDIVTTNTTTTTTTPGGAVQTVQAETIQSATITPGFNFNNLPLGNSASAKSLSTRENVAAQGLSNFSLGRVNNELGFGGFVFSAGNESVSLLLRALQETRRLEVLSRPQIMTLDNQPAFIQVGQRVPRITGTTINQTGQVNNIQLENVGLILGVTPRISPDGLVVMEIDAEKSEVGSEAEGIPVSISATGQVIRSPRVNISTAQTTVSALSGQTVVLGGLITRSNSQVQRRLPLVADIPLIGWLFRYDSQVIRRTELLIVMTPRIVRNEADVEELKRTESARMSWVLCDVVDLHGPAGLLNRQGDWTDPNTDVIYPTEGFDQNYFPPPGADRKPEIKGLQPTPATANSSVLKTASYPESLPQPISIEQNGRSSYAAAPASFQTPVQLLPPPPPANSNAPARLPASSQGGP